MMHDTGAVYASETMEDPRKNSTINGVCDVLRNRSDQLEKVVAELGERLHPLLTMTDPVPVSDESKVSEVDSRGDHAKFLVALSSRVEESTERLRRLLDRLEI